MRGIQLSPGVGSPPAPPGDLEDEEGLKHLQQVWGCLSKQRAMACLCLSQTLHFSRFSPASPMTQLPLPAPAPCSPMPVLL